MTLPPTDTGFGFVVASVEWTEYQKPKNSSSRTLYDFVEGTSVGNIFNFGVGKFINKHLEMRFEAPMLLLYSSTGNAASFVPTISLSLSYRFNK